MDEKVGNSGRRNGGRRNGGRRSGGRRNGGKQGELPEWTNGLAWKACEVVKDLRGFESHTLRVKKLDPSEDLGSVSSSTGSISDEEAMDLALAQARLATEIDNVPVGSVVLLGDRVLSARHNERRQTGDPTAHAEVLALRDAANILDTWHLDDTTLVTTLEPCLMCAGAAVFSRVKRVVFGAFDPKAGAAGTLYNVLVDPRLNHQCEVTSGIKQDECGELLRMFFADRR